ncbi:MAG: hypothetical protein H0W73_01770 [Bacteroidetes bacterium]|nr:hypothetical protein [Bacteroidota bacterium]
MSSEKEFKDALKEKLNAKEFQFDEVNWLKASGMLDATREEKKKRPFPYFLVSGILLFVTIGSFVIYKFSDHTTAVKETAATNTNTQLPETKQASNNEITAYQKQNENIYVTEEKTNTETKPVNEKTELAVLNEKIETTNTEKSISQNSVKNQAEETKNTSTINIRSKKQKTTIIKNAVVFTPNQEKENTVPVKQNNEPEKQTQVNTIVLPTVVESNTVAETKTTVNEAKAEEVVTYVPETNTISVDPVKSVVAVAEPVKRDSTLKLKEPAHFVSFEAGTSYLFGWNNPGKRDANGVNPIVGLNYSNTLNTPFIFSMGIHYTMVRNLSYSNHVVTTTRYNFGEETDVMVFTPTTMHYLLAPIKFGYTFKEKNIIGIGYNAAYLFNVNSNVELYAQTADKKGNATVLKTSGYTQGFKTLDSQASLFYRRKLGKDLWLNTEFIYGLTDVKDNKFFNSNVFERNMGLKLTLIYNLFKK